jgi:hypothetical protein
MSKKGKGPKFLVPPSSEKKPSAQFDSDYQKMRPAWRVSLLEVIDPFGWHTIDSDDLQQVRVRLAALESMTWREILVQGSYRNHPIAISRLCAEAQKRLEDIQQDDIDSLISLGITQKGRVFGILEHNILNVLWWDPDHDVCPVEKPNT